MIPLIPFDGHLPKDTGSDHDLFCRELKFFAKIIYVLTGSCALDHDTVLYYCSQFSQACGILSLVCWLFAQLPQILKNHQRRSMDGVSLTFLTCWALGDFLNFSSCLLTGAMLFQVLLSAYYCIIDLILAFQYYYYTSYAKRHPTLRLKKTQRLHNIKTPNSMLRQKLRQLSGASPSPAHNGTTGQFHEIDSDARGFPAVPLAHIDIPKTHSFGLVDEHDGTQSSSSAVVRNQTPMSFSKLISSSFIMGFSKVQGAPIGPTKSSTVLQSALILVLQAPQLLNLGKLLSWMCTCLYLCSRLPQLITNYRNKSCKGVSILLFAAALSGNVLYSCSLLTAPDALAGGEVTQEFWRKELSYFLGASLTVGFDLILLYQWYIWDHLRSVRKGRSSRLGHSQGHHQIHPVLSDLISLNDPVPENNNTPARSPIVMLSPKHARKLSELQPLSPHDFLIDGYLATRGGDDERVVFAKRVVSK